MPRKNVIQLESVTYHVTSRCLQKLPLMKEDFFKAIFLEIIAQTQVKYKFELNHFTIMDNHFHLIIHTLPGGATISRIMQYIKARFAERYNKLTGRIGPFWNERYSYTIIEHAADPVLYLLWLIWYIAYNAVKAGLVSDPRDYPFGGINAYLREDYISPVKITIHKFVLAIGESFKERLEVLLKYEKAYVRRLSWIMEW